MNLKGIFRRITLQGDALPELKEPLFRQELVAFTGAGISVESGVPSYRDSNGTWSSVDPEEYATAAAFYENPQKVLDYYNKLRHIVHEAKPNRAHRMLAELERWHDVTIITQNTDDLHERAGSTNVIHLHGELAKITSSKDRLNPDCIRKFPLNQAIKIGDKASDGTQMRPYVVWFDEFAENIDIATKIARDADIFVAIGTSLRVSPASLIVKYPHHSVPKYTVNPADLSDRLPDGYIQIRETATRDIDRFIEELMKL